VTATASYTVTLKTHDGFAVPAGFTVALTGLPIGTSWKLQLISYAIDATGTAQSTYNLIITAQSNAVIGLYALDFKMTAITQGTTISHDVSTLQVEIATS
jgi:hypothetical protein